MGNILLLSFNNLINTKLVYPSWKLIYFGIVSNYLNPNSVEKFANYLLEHSLDVDFCIEILNQETLDDALILLQNHLDIQDTDAELYLRQLRIVFLEKLLKKLDSKDITQEEFLEELAELYENYNYPEDMQKMIYYMPLDSNEQGGTSYLMSQFRNFYSNELRWLGNESN